MSLNEYEAKQKYLKYKAKYNQLKQQIDSQQGGVISTKIGWYTYLMSAAVWALVKEKLNVNGIAPSNAEINEILNMRAWRVGSFSDKVELVQNVSSTGIASALAAAKIKASELSTAASNAATMSSAKLVSSGVDADLVSKMNECVNNLLEEQKKRNVQIIEERKKVQSQSAADIEAANYFNKAEVNTIVLPFKYLANNEKELLAVNNRDERIKEHNIKVRDAIQAHLAANPKLNSAMTAAMSGAPVFDTTAVINISAFGKNKFMNSATI